MGASLQGRAGLVTGGGSGIGRAIALALAEEGARVTIADVRPDAGEQTRQLVQEKGGEAIFVRCDVTRDEDVRRLVAKAVASHGRLDCAVNNAGIEGALAPTGDYPEEEWDRVIATDLKGVWLCMKHELREMVGVAAGAIVNTASVAGLVGSRGMPAYTAAKHGVVGLTKAAALEYATAGIRVNAICPGVVETSMVERLVASEPRLDSLLTAAEPVGRRARPEEIAAGAVWLCSDAASFVTGHAMVIDGGFVAR